MIEGDRKMSKTRPQRMMFLRLSCKRRQMTNEQRRQLLEEKSVVGVEVEM
jgi:hypothetical protein